MLVFGCCIGPSGKFATVAEPALTRVMRPGDVLVREQGADGICAAYNRILEQARDLDDCEGVVLLHDDVALGDLAREQVLAALGGPGVGVVGVVGGSGLFGPQWVNARRLAGHANDSYGWRRFGPPEADVDVVDGLMLALSPAAFRAIGFDPEAFPAFHGYDTDYCLQVRRAGLRVRVVHVDHVHRDKGGLGDERAFARGAAALLRKWPDAIRALDARERPAVWVRDRAMPQLGRARHRLMVGAKRVLRRT